MEYFAQYQEKYLLYRWENHAWEQAEGLSAQSHRIGMEEKAIRKDGIKRKNTAILSAV